MKALLLKDLYNLSKNGKTTFLVLLIYGVFSLLTAQASYLSSMIAVFCAILPISSFSFDDFSKWDNYALSMPISRKQIVLSKYLLSFLMILIGSAISIIFGSIFMLVHGTSDFNILSLLFTTLAIGVACIILCSLLLPIIIKFGAEKARLFMVALFLIPVCAVLLLVKSKMWLPGPDQISSIIALTVKLSPLILLAIVIISIFTSVKLYKAKEF